MAGHTIQVSVLADTTKLGKAFSGLGEKLGLGKLGSMVKGVGVAVGAAAAAAGTAAVGIVGKSISLAGDLEQSIGAVDAVFKGGAKGMHEFGKTAAESVGLTRNEFNQLSTVLGSQLKNGGTSITELGGKTQDLVKLGSDLSAMFGGSTSDAVGALSSALKGERDPIEKYGVSLKQATIEAKALEMGFKKGKDGFSGQATQAATLALIMDQTKDAQGAFGRETNTLAHQQQVLKAKLHDAGASLGMLFLPAATAVARFLADRFTPAAKVVTEWVGGYLMPAMVRFGQWMQTTLLPIGQQVVVWAQANLLPALQQTAQWVTGSLLPALAGVGQWLVGAQGWLLPVVAAIAAMVLAWRAWVTITGIWTAVVNVAKAAQAAWNVVMAANPISIIILLIVGFIAALVVLYNRNETARRIMDNAWRAIRGAISAVVGWITGTMVPAITRAWTAVSSGATSLWSSISGTFTRIRSTISGAISSIIGTLNSFRSSASSVTSAVGGFFNALPGRIVGALAGVGGRLAGIGYDMISGLVSGLSPDRVIAKMRSVIGDAVGFAKRLLGIASPSKLFRQFGRWTTEGYALGIGDEAQGAVRSVGAVTRRVIAAAPRALPLPAIGAGRGTTMAGAGVTINASMLEPTPEVVRQLARMMRDASRTGML